MRSRVYENDWTIVDNTSYDSSPFPVGPSDGIQTRSVYGPPDFAGLDWGLRVWAQFDDAYSGGGCNYGGGVGLVKPSQSGSYSTEPLASP